MKVVEGAKARRGNRASIQLQSAGRVMCRLRKVPGFDGRLFWGLSWGDGWLIGGEPRCGGMGAGRTLAWSPRAQHLSHLSVLGGTAPFAW